jgi:CRP-like cAMP-binding protein
MQHYNQFLARLTPSQLALMTPLFKEVILRANTVIYEPDDRVEWVYFPSSGAVSIVTVMSDGRSVEVATVGNESLIGAMPALTGARVHSRHFVQIECGALKLLAADLRAQINRDPGLLRLLLVQIHHDSVQVEQSVACNALHDVRHRLARWLLLSHDRVGGRVLPLTHEFLAIMLGVQRSTLTAAAHALRATGVVAYQRGKIRILDRPRLETMACECYEATLERQRSLAA